MIDFVRQPDERFLAMLPAIKRQARKAFRKVNAIDRADLVADVVAQSFCAYRRLVERGRESLAYATPLANYAIKHLNDGRRVTGQESAGEVLSYFCQRSGAFKVTSVDSTIEASLADKHAKPDDVVALRLDFCAWLKTLRAGDRLLIAFLAIGNRPSDAASHFQVSRARISQRRRELGESWERFQGA
jgi:hypothetical protein